MKKLFLIVFIAIAGCQSTPQNQTEIKSKDETEQKTEKTERQKGENTKSNIEGFINQSNILIKKDFIDIGLIKKAKVKTLIVTDLLSGIKYSGVRFEADVYNGYSSDSKIAFIDSDEVDDLIKAIDKIQTTIFPTNPFNYTEITFKTRSGFEAGCFYSEGKWSTYLTLVRFDANSEIFLEQTDFQTMKDLLIKAKSKF